jgi:uncharacterized damage-inducible protein DinB
VDKSYIADNNRERERLKALVERLSDEQLSRPMPGGWTVAAVLAHMAFWDARALHLMDKWENGAEPSRDDWEPDNIDWVNDASKVLCLALPPRRAALLAVEVAEQTDRRVEALSDELLAKLIELGPPFNLSRAEHRKEHLDEIEAQF